MYTVCTLAASAAGHESAHGCGLTFNDYHMLAAFVFAHVRQRGSSERTWIALTLLFGLGGIVGYLLGRRR
ncbi:MAG: hypothetical protein IH933_02450 [Euryarchaeota archaeon]|nr:hypothetical protein [Euryarchaeota archaeon]